MKKTIIIYASLVLFAYVSVVIYQSIKLVSTGMFSLYNVFAFSLPNILLLTLAVVGVTVYIAPTLLSCILDSKNKTTITLINILLGWSFFGWVASLVMAITNRKI